MIGLLLLPALLINLASQSSAAERKRDEIETLKSIGKGKSGASIPTAIKTPITIAKHVRFMVKHAFVVLSLFLSVFTTTLLTCKIEAFFSGFLNEFFYKSTVKENNIHTESLFWVFIFYF